MVRFKRRFRRGYIPNHSHATYPACLRTKQGREAFLILSDRVCPNHSDTEIAACSAIGMWLTLIVGDITLPANGDVNGNTVLPERKLEVHSLDSYNAALGEFTPRRLRKLEKTIGDIINSIERLRRTPLVSELRSRGRFGRGDLLHRSLLIPSSAPFEGILTLRSMAKGILGDPRKPKRPDYDECLAGLYNTIHRNSRHWHDRLVADILNDALQPIAIITEDSQRKWRHDHKLLLDS